MFGNSLSGESWPPRLKPSDFQARRNMHFQPHWQPGYRGCDLVSANETQPHETLSEGNAAQNPQQKLLEMVQAACLVVEVKTHD